MALSYPHANWEFVSIHLMLEPVDIDNHHCLTQVSGMSQDYELLPPPLNEDNDEDSLVVEIVVACHSHAPLQESWNRILLSLKVEGGVELEDPKKKKHQHRVIAITIACCSNYSDLDQKPILAFHDYEVYSPKRHIKIYND
jgi:hypothetical protein